MICLSTDKAVYPINAMGTSKAMMEKVAIGKARAIDPERMTICCTRYGNVMASRGSVIPLFVRQILAGEPLTITDPDMTRFMMTLDHAVDLVLFGYEHGATGDVLVQKPRCDHHDPCSGFTGAIRETRSPDPHPWDPAWRKEARGLAVTGGNGTG